MERSVVVLRDSWFMHDVWEENVAFLFSAICSCD